MADLPLRGLIGTIRDTVRCPECRKDIDPAQCYRKHDDAPDEAGKYPGPICPACHERIGTDDPLEVTRRWDPA
jgi:hypothetical protein